MNQDVAYARNTESGCKVLVVVLSSLRMNGNKLKRAKIPVEIILALRYCDLCDYAGTHGFS